MLRLCAPFRPVRRVPRALCVARPHAAGNGSNLLANLLPAVPGKLTSVGSLSLIEGNKAGSAVPSAF